MTNILQIQAAKCISQDVLKHLPQAQAARVTYMIELMQRKIINHYQMILYYKQRSTTFYKLLRLHGFLTVHRPREAGISRWSIKRKLNFVKQNITYHDSTLGDTADLISRYTQDVINDNEEVRDLIQADMNKIFLREQSVINHNRDQEWDSLVRVVFGGLIQGWSTRDFKKINDLVCGCCVYHINLCNIKN